MKLIQVVAGVVVNATTDDNRTDAPEGWQAHDTAQIGWVFNGQDFVAPEPVPPTAEEVRAERDGLLAASDWTQVADAPVDQTAWAAYRQALRDVPDQVGFPQSIIWPVAPSQ